MRALSELLRTLATALPPWAAGPLAGILLLLAIPAWLRWLRTKQIRGRIRRSLRAPSPAARRREEAAAFALAGNRGILLVALADEAMRLHQAALLRRALEKLEATGQYPKDLGRLRAGLEPAPRRAAHPIEEVQAIRRLWREGLTRAALARLEEGRRRFPEDTDLRALAQELESPPGPSDDHGELHTGESTVPDGLS